MPVANGGVVTHPFIPSGQPGYYETWLDGNGKYGISVVLGGEQSAGTVARAVIVGEAAGRDRKPGESYHSAYMQAQARVGVVRDRITNHGTVTYKEV